LNYNKNQIWWEYTQRLIAIFLFIPAFVILLPFGLYIYLNSPGAVFIKQLREGKKGSLFHMYKLRTMVLDAENYLQKYLNENPSAQEEWVKYGRLTNDPRIIGVIAKFTRRFSIDELPQLLNVIRGEMNLVGPRPLPPEIAKLLHYNNLLGRREVFPGITGLWQISGRSELSLSEIGRLDIEYIKNRTISNDLSILFRTFSVVVSGKGAY
jgi:lipopolysaccharide/colanic/teichoic acid biosynthesis glycosyltransferase